MHQVPLLHVVRRPAGVEDELLAVILLVGGHVGRIDRLRERHFVGERLAAIRDVHFITRLQLIDLTKIFVYSETSHE